MLTQHLCFPSPSCFLTLPPPSPPSLTPFVPESPPTPASLLPPPSTLSPSSPNLTITGAWHHLPVCVSVEGRQSRGRGPGSCLSRQECQVNSEVIFQLCKGEDWRLISVLNISEVQAFGGVSGEPQRRPSWTVQRFGSFAWPAPTEEIQCSNPELNLIFRANSGF